MNHYFYIDSEGNQKGTFSPEELRKEGIRKETRVWTQGKKEWRRADRVEELKPLFGIVAPTVSQSSTALFPQNHVGAPQSNAPTVRMPKSWLLESILVTILPTFLCGNFLSFLLGVIAIIYAAQVEPHYRKGNYEASLESSRSAKRMTRVAFWTTLGWILILVAGVILYIVFVGSYTGLDKLLNV